MIDDSMTSVLRIICDYGNIFIAHREINPEVMKKAGKTPAFLLPARPASGHAKFMESRACSGFPHVIGFFCT